MRRFIAAGVVGAALVLASAGEASAQVYNYYNPYTGRVSSGVSAYNPYTGTVNSYTTGGNVFTGAQYARQGYVSPYGLGYGYQQSYYNPYFGAGYRTGAYNPFFGGYGYGYGYRRW